jgi:formylglycine-generating enzyme required for sulfatase activity
MMRRQGCFVCIGVSLFAAFAVGVCVCPAADEKPTGSYVETVAFDRGVELSLTMAAIPGGSFSMGSKAGAVGAKEDEGPQHEVQISPFYLCTTETTLELFLAYYQETMTHKKSEDDEPDEKEQAEDVDAITGPTPVYGDLTMGYGPKNPAVGMTWHNATNFCAWLSRRTGKEYRLPTEAEWEYACRAGSKNAYCFGNDPNKLAEYAWHKPNSDMETHEAATKKANAWGLYDMHGNVSEWVSDFYSPTAYKEAAQKTPAVNPKGPAQGKVHVARGGNHTNQAEDLRSAARSFEEKWWRAGDPQIPKSKWWLPDMDHIGFRVARSADKDDAKEGNE